MALEPMALQPMALQHPLRYFSIPKGPQYLKADELYERKAVTDIWNKLTIVSKQQWKWKNVSDKEDMNKWKGIRTKKRVIQVLGPPGSGKSSAVFYWVNSVCENVPAVQAVWINCSTVSGMCWKIARDQSAGGPATTVEKYEVPTLAEGVEFAHIVVFDGIRQSTLDQWRNQMNELAREGIFVIVVSSEGVIFHRGDSNDIAYLEHRVPSWTDQEYYDACRSNRFWDDVCEVLDGSRSDDEQRRKELVDIKFESAGHSARFMFDDPKVDVQRDIRAKTLCLRGNVSSLVDAVKFDRANGAANTLIARLHDTKNGSTPPTPASFPTEQDMLMVAASREDMAVSDNERDQVPGISQPRIVSGYAAEELRSNLPTSIAQMRELARALDNKAIEGYALEQQLKKSLEEASLVSNGNLSLEIDDQLKSFPVFRFISCGTDELQRTIVQHYEIPNTWIFVAGRQGAFDAVHIVSKTHIRFVQATAGTTHTFCLDIIDNMMKELLKSNVTWQYVEFMVLRPLSEKDISFALKPARGKIAEYTRFDEVKWDTRDYRNNVRYAFLRWNYTSNVE